MTKKLDIPFVKSRGFECGQACAAMIIKYYYPEFEVNFDKINEIIHHEKGKYTFPLQLAILLDTLNINTKCFSSDDYKTQSEDPDQFKRWWGDDYDSNIGNLNREMFDWVSVMGKKLGLLTIKNTNFEELIEHYKGGHVVAIPIDWNTLTGNVGQYVGHFVIITFVDKQKDLVYVNDPDVGKDQKHKLSLLKKSWEHPAIIDDYIIAYGKK